MTAGATDTIQRGTAMIPQRAIELLGMVLTGWRFDSSIDSLDTSTTSKSGVRDERGLGKGEKS